MNKKRVFSRALSLCIVCALCLQAGIQAVCAKDTEAAAYRMGQPETTKEYGDFERFGGNVISQTVIPQQYESRATVFKEGKQAFPSSYSAMEGGLVTPAKNQGNLNTCWVFAGLSSFETAMLKNGFGPYDFSEEHANHWSAKRENGTGWQRNFYDAGYSQMIRGYLTSWSGPRLESEIPYRSGDGLTFSQLDKGKTSFGANGLVFLADDHATIKRAVLDYGSVTAGCSTIRKYFSRDLTAFACLDDIPPGADAQGHVVAVTGWDDSFPKERFNAVSRPKNDGAWLVKSSWGTQRGENGFYWISYEDKLLFSKRFGKNYAVTDVQKIKRSMRLLQNEIYGATWDMTVYEEENGNKIYQNGITYANVFDFSGGYHTIEQVIFESECVGAGYTVHYIPLENGVPTEDTAKWLELAKGSVPYSGYISCGTTRFEAPGGRAAIGVTIDATGTGRSCSLGVGEWLENTTAGRITFLPDPKAGDSYLFLAGKAYELMEFYKTENNDEIGGTLVIKTVVSKKETGGDIDGDGFLTVADILSMQKHIARILIIDEDIIAEAADLNKDGVLSVADVLAAQNILAKKPTE